MSFLSCALPGRRPHLRYQYCYLLTKLALDYALHPLDGNVPDVFHFFFIANFGNQANVGLSFK